MQLRPGLPCCTDALSAYGGGGRGKGAKEPSKGVKSLLRTTLRPACPVGPSSLPPLMAPSSLQRHCADTDRHLVLQVILQGQAAGEEEVQGARTRNSDSFTSFPKKFPLDKRAGGGRSTVYLCLLASEVEFRHPKTK